MHIAVGNGNAQTRTIIFLFIFGGSLLQCIIIIQKKIFLIIFHSSIFDFLFQGRSLTLCTPCIHSLTLSRHIYSFYIFLIFFFNVELWGSAPFARVNNLLYDFFSHSTHQRATFCDSTTNKYDLLKYFYVINIIANSHASYKLDENPNALMIVRLVMHLVVISWFK